MGAWGIGHFDNDDALDYIALVIKAEDTSLLMRSLETVIHSDVVASYECTEALAAAEVVAALFGFPGELPEEAIEWVKRTEKPIDNQLKELAIQAIKRIATTSELKDLWDEADDGEFWSEEVQELLKRLV